MTLTWRPAPDAGVGGYVVLRGEGRSAGFEIVATLQGAGVGVFIDRGSVVPGKGLVPLGDGVTYRYAVTAVGLAGGQSAMSELASATTLGPPEPPSNLTATTNRPREIALAWNHNPSTGIVEYVVGAADAQAGPYADVGRVPPPPAGAAAAFTERLAADGAYRWYRVQAIGLLKLVGRWSAPACGRTRPAPPAPGAIVPMYRPGEVELAWDVPAQVSLVREFRLWARRRGEWDLFRVVRPPIALLTWRDLRGGLSVAVSLVDGQGLESVRSAPVALYEPAPPVPMVLDAAPSGLRGVQLTWPDPQDNAEYYRIERRPAFGGDFVTAGRARARKGSWLDEGTPETPLGDGAEYSYRAFAVNGDGRESAPSREVGVTTAPPPSPPPDVRASSPSARAAIVTWGPSPSAEVTHYLVERAGPAVPAAYVRVAETRDLRFAEGGSPSSALEDSTEYLYRVRSVNRVGAVSEPSPPAPVVTLPPPARVQRFRAAGGHVRCVPLEWAPSPEPDVVRYVILRSLSREGPFDPVATVSGRETARHLDGGADPGQLADQCTYVYRIHAVNAVGATSVDSAVAEAITRAPPPVVQGVRAESAQPRRVPLAWQVSTDEKATGYVVRRATGESGDAFEEVARLNGREANVWTDRGGARDRDPLAGLADDTVYRYQVAAFNAALALSPWSEPAAARTKSRPHAPPRPVCTTNMARSVSIAWLPSPEPDVLRYVVEGSDAGRDRFRAVGAVPADRTPLRAADGALADDVRRVYRIKAVDRDGLESDWSDAGSGRTRGRPAPPSGLSAEWDGGMCVLTWRPSASAGVTGYEVQRSGLLAWRALAPTAECACRIAREAVGRGVKVAVVAQDADGLRSDRSEELVVVPPAAR